MKRLRNAGERKVTKGGKSLSLTAVGRKKNGEIKRRREAEKKFAAIFSQ